MGDISNQALTCIQSFGCLECSYIV
jgi:hypothetical protein